MQKIESLHLQQSPWTSEGKTVNMQHFEQQVFWTGKYVRFKEEILQCFHTQKILFKVVETVVLTDGCVNSCVSA